MSSLAELPNSNARAGSAVAEAFNVFAQPPKMTVSEWADAYREMVDKEAVEGGRWRTERTPYLRGVMDAMDHPRIRRVTIMKAERLGGTEALFNALYYYVDRRPGNVLWVYPKDDVAQHIVTKRIIPTIKECAAIRAHLSGSPRDIKVMEIEFDRMFLKSVGSNSESNLEMAGYRRVFIDERDRCVADVVSKVMGRVSAFADSKIVECGTPSEEGIGIDGAYRESDRREFYVPCAMCGHFHIRTFEHIKWLPGPDGHATSADPDRVATGAWFRCPNKACAEAIHGYRNQWQLSRGLWVPSVCVVETGKAIGSGTVVFADTGKAWNEGDTGSHAGFHLRGALQPFKANPYGYIAEEFVRNKGKVDRQWVNRRLGEAWSPPGKKLEAEALRILCPIREQGGYRMGEAPAAPGIDPSRVVSQASLPIAESVEIFRNGVLALTAMCDVQQDRIVVEVVGWGLFGHTCWLVEHAEIPRTLGDGLAPLAPFLLRTWPLVHRPTGTVLCELPLVAAGIDSGHFTDEVYPFVLAREQHRVYATKGRSHLGVGQESFKWSRVEKASSPALAKLPASMQGGLPLLLIGTDRIKNNVQDALQAAITLAQRENRTDVTMAATAMPHGAKGIVGVHGSVRFPEATPDAYFRELTSEKRTDIVRDGQRSYRWALRPGRTDNHALDCRVGNIAIAQAMGVGTLKPRYLAEILRKNTKAEATQPVDTERSAKSTTDSRSTARNSVNSNTTTRRRPDRPRGGWMEAGR